MPPLPENLRALLGPIAGGILLFVLGAVGIAWLSIAGAAIAVAMLGPIWGPATVGAVMLAPLGVFSLIAWAKTWRAATAPPPQGAASADASLAAIAAAAHKLIEKSPLAALALTTLAGLLATRYPVGLSLLANVLSASERPQGN